MTPEAARVRMRILTLAYGAKCGHIGSCLSAVEPLIDCFDAMRPQDKFVYGKSHAAMALYALLAERGQIPWPWLQKTFYRDGTNFGGHTGTGLGPQIPFGGGSLGHGLSQAAGLALGAQLRDEGARVYCLLGDGDLQEGSTFEAARFIGEHGLDVRVHVDFNGWQALGQTLTPVMIEDVYTQLLFCEWHRTTKGAGVSFMENKLEWHYRTLDEQTYAAACAEIEKHL